MSAPSFSSFLLSFGSFPESFASGSNPKKDASPDKDAKHRVRDKHSRKSSDTQEKDRRRAKDSKHEQESKHEKSAQKRGKHGDYDTGEDAYYTPPAKDAASLLYYSDRRGDPLNVTYGGIHTGDVPKYRLFAGGRRILGLPQLVVSRRYDKVLEIGPSGRHRQPQLTDSRTRNLLATIKPRRLEVTAKSASRYDEIDGFIRLPSRLRKSDEQAYRSIKARPPSDSDSESTTWDGEDLLTSDSEPETLSLTVREVLLRDLEQRLARDPSSVETWLRLLNQSVSSIPIDTKNSDRARSEITVSVLTRALGVHPDNKRSDVLVLKYLRAGEVIWAEEKLNDEWQQVLKEPGTADVWLEWLEWRMRRATSSIDAILEDASRALLNIDRTLSKEGADTARLRIFWRVAVFLRQAGYSERAFALFQAQAQLLFKFNGRLQALPFELQLDILEEFWESEDRRIGDSSSEGASSAPDGALDDYERWAATECKLDSQHRFVSRSDTEDDNDPYGVILFSDLRPFIVDIRTVEGKRSFRLAWLSFTGLHVPGFTASLSQLSQDAKWAETSYSEQRFLDKLFPKVTRIIDADSVAGVLVGREKQYRNSFEGVKEWRDSVFDPLEAVLLNGGGRMWEAFDGPTEVVRSIFLGLRSADEDDEWDVIHIAFEAAINLRNAVKLSKSLLSRSDVSVILWAAHARLERMRGKFDEARKVYETVVSALTSDDPSAAQLWSDYAEMQWLTRGDDAATTVILRAAGQTADKGTLSILRAKRRLEELDNGLASTSTRTTLHWVQLRVLLELLTGSMQSAIDVAKRRMSELDNGSILHEAMTVKTLELLYHYSVMLRHPAQPGLLRDLVHSALDIYPDNTIILGLFLECEKGEGVWGRVRAILGDSGAQRGKSLSRRVSEVWISGWEVGRWQGEIERTRVGLEAAVVGDSTRGSAILWRIYVEFELRAGALKRAKTVLFRSLGECPFVKELYVLAFGPLRQVFQPRELATLAETMVERGIRIRGSLDELLGLKISGGKMGRDDNDGEYEDDELEKSAKELRRLMPY